MTEHKVKLDRANKSILLRALGDVYYGQRARGGSAEETGRLILRVNDLPTGGKLTMSAAEYRLAKAALNQLRTQRLAEGGYGLGLLIVGQVAATHNGDFKLSNVFPQGCEATLIFPYILDKQANFADVWIYVRCANSDPRIAFDRLYDLIDEAAGHGFLVRGTSFDHCSGNTLKDRIGLRTMLDAVENGRVEAVMVRDLEQISRNSYILVGVIEILRQNDVYLITTECDLNAELINSGLERFVGDRFTRASFGKPRFDVRLPLMDQF